MKYIRLYILDSINNDFISIGKHRGKISEKIGVQISKYSFEYFDILIFADIICNISSIIFNIDNNEYCKIKIIYISSFINIQYQDFAIKLRENILI